jgi:PAS domain S-box-containing protein
MLQYIKQNKHVIMVAVTLFVISMSTLLFFFGSNGGQKDLKTDVIGGGSNVTESINVKSAQDDEQSYRTIVNNEEDPVFVMNVDGTIKFSSWNVESTLGYKPDELQHQIFFLMIHPDDLSTFLGAFGKVIQNKKPVTMVGPYRLRDKNGEYHLHMGSLFPIVVQGNVDSIAIASKDISSTVQPDQPQQNQGKKPATVPKGKKIMNDNSSQQSRFLADMNVNLDENIFPASTFIQFLRGR